MSESLLDEALSFSRRVITELPESSDTRALEARLGILERACWAVPLIHTSTERVVQLAKLVLDLRDEVASVGPRTVS